MGDSAVETSTAASSIERIAKALAHELRIKILTELNKRVMSPSQFYNEFGDDTWTLTKVSRHFRELENYGCIEEVDRKIGGPRRGGVEHFFRATQRSLFDSPIWDALPDSIKNEVTGATFRNYIEHVAEAMAAGTLDARDERHFTWTALLLDQQAWDRLIERVDALFRFALELAVEAGTRMAETGEKPIPTTVALAAFESPSMSGEAGPTKR